MNLADYSNDKLEQSKAYVPFWPNGEPMDAKIFLRSLKSTDVLQEVERVNRRLSQGGKGIEQHISADIDICCAVIDAIEGFEIQDADNKFGFETDSGSIISNKKNIRILMENFLFLRHQIASKAQDDGFFYQN